MAKGQILTGSTGDKVHVRTTADDVKSEGVVLAIDGTDSVVPADTGNGLDVDVTRLPALPTGANVIGKVDQGTAGASAWLVTGPLTDAQLRATALPVSGPLTDAQLRAAAVPVSDGGGSLTVDGTVGLSGTVDVSDRDVRLLGRTKQLDSGGVVIDPAKEHVTAASPHATRLTDGTAFYKATTPADTQPVSGPLTDAQLRAAAVPVSDGGGSLTVDGAVGVTGNVGVTNVAANPAGVRLSDGAAYYKATTPADTQPVSGPLTDAQLRAAAVPVSGPLTDAQLRASAISVLASGDVDHDAGNTLKTVQVGGHASRPDMASYPAQVAIGDRARMMTDKTGVQFTRRRRNGTVMYPFKALATGALVAATRKDVLSIEHAATVFYDARVMRLVLTQWFQTTALAGNVIWELYSGTAASSAGTFVAGLPTHRSWVAQSSIKTLPTIVAATGPYVVQRGPDLTAAANVMQGPLTVYEWDGTQDGEPLTVRSGVLESLVLAVTSSVAHNLTVYGYLELQEELI